MFTDHEDIDRTLRAALNVGPSSDFDDRVLRRVENDRPSGRPAAAAWLGAAAAIMLGVAAWILGAREDRPVPADAVSVSHPVAVDGSLSPRAAAEPPVLPPAPSASEPARRRRSISRPPDVATAAPVRPEVIVPANQLELIHRFLRAVNTGYVDPSERVATEAALEELIVPPLIVPPIPIVSLEPGGGSIFGPKGLQ